MPQKYIVVRKIAIIFKQSISWWSFLLYAKVIEQFFFIITIAHLCMKDRNHSKAIFKVCPCRFFNRFRPYKYAVTSSCNLLFFPGSLWFWTPCYKGCSSNGRTTTPNSKVTAQLGNLEEEFQRSDKLESFFSKGNFGKFQISKPEELPFLTFLYL